MTFAPAVAPGWVRRNRGYLALGGGLLVVLTLLALLTAGGKSGDLDPDAYNPEGSHALATLLADEGVRVHRTTDLPSTAALADRHATVFVPRPQELSDEELEGLADLPSHLVIVGADPGVLSQIDDSVEVHDSVRVETRDPDCALPAATRAGRADVGGFTYRGAASCYDGTLLERTSSGLVLLGSGEPLRNANLDQEGNAALALGLLGQQPSLVWLVPDPDRAALGTRPIRSPGELLPDWVAPTALQLGVALVVLAMWRARRLGRVVPEPLPVVVRAAETIEGRGRLYEAAHARHTAAQELRGGTRERLGPRVGAGRNPTPDTLVTALASHTGRKPEEITALLYGPQPADDAALVRLADDLDALTREVTGS